jgi:hypothetical protein
LASFDSCLDGFADPCAFGVEIYDAFERDDKGGFIDHDLHRTARRNSLDIRD